MCEKTSFVLWVSASLALVEVVLPSSSVAVGPPVVAVGDFDGPAADVAVWNPDEVVDYVVVMGRVWSGSIEISFSPVLVLRFLDLSWFELVDPVLDFFRRVFDAAGFAASAELAVFLWIDFHAWWSIRLAE